MARLKPVILCGGSGERLWSLSRKSYPKQFLNLIGEGSRSQQPDDCKSLIEDFSDEEMPLTGSSLKLCFIAEGKASLHPRLGPISECYAASLQAIVEAAVGQALRPYFVTASMNITTLSLHH